MSLADPEAQARDVVVCLAAGSSQLPILRRLSTLNVDIMAVDMQSDAPGLALAHEYVACSTHDVDCVLRELSGMLRGRKIAGVVCGSFGPPTVTAATVCERWGLPGVPLESARIILDKHRFVEACSHFGLHSPSHWRLEDPLLADWDSFSYPLVLKPTHTTAGKAGVYLASTAASARALISTVSANSATGFVEVEEFIDGTDVMLVGFVDEGVFIPLALVDELNRFGEGGVLVGEGLSVPSRFEGTKVSEHIFDAAQTVARGLSVTRSPFVLSTRVSSSGQVYPIELHTQLGGDFLFEGLLEECASIDLTGIILMAMVGLPAEIPRVRIAAARTLRGADGNWRVCADAVAADGGSDNG